MNKILLSDTLYKYFNIPFVNNFYCAQKEIWGKKLQKCQRQQNFKEIVKNFSICTSSSIRRIILAASSYKERFVVY